MDTLEKLFADHERLRDVLAVLKRELTAGEAADLQFMYDTVTHYSEYFNRVHHPMEDRLFEHLLRRDAFRQHGTERALMEHGELSRYTARFQSLLDQALHGGIVAREDLIHSGWRFLDANLDHMAHEEQTAFAWARAELNKTDWAAIGSHPVTHGLTAVHATSVESDCARYLHRPH